ncbi:hypothetical protein A2U01_0063108, partial [Trifolium medium]|nr:hypothetical protein [Trifolium medium]
VRGDNPTHDDDLESCHGEEMQSDVEADASDGETPALLEDAYDTMIETCGIVVGMTTDCPT